MTRRTVLVPGDGSTNCLATPRTNDSASLKITCADGSVLTVSGTGSKVNKGNLQAHY